MDIENREMKLLLLILILGLGLRMFGSAVFPLWSGPDEPAHYFFIQYIGENGELPQIKLTTETLRSVYNESIHQPPLYYMVMSIPYKLVAGQSESFIIHFLRLFSVFLGTATIWLTYLIAQRLGFSERTRLASAGFVAFLPTHVIVSSVVNNSPLSWVFCLAAIYTLIKVFEDKRARDMVTAGVLMAAIVLTKYTGLSVAIVFAAACLVFLFKGRGNFVKRLAICAIPLISMPIILRNLALSGSIMPNHLTEAIQVNLKWFNYYVTHLFPSVWLQEYGTAIIPDFRFAFFAFYAIVSLTALIGFAALLKGKEWNPDKKKLVAIVLIAPIVLNLVGVTYINLFGNYPDGKWLFETIGLAAIIFVLGQQQFMRLFKQERLAGYAIWFILLTMLFLDLFVLVFHNRILPAVPWPL